MSKIPRNWTKLMLSKLESIKEELNNEVNIINAEIYNNGFLEKIEITKFNNKNNVIDVIIAEKADIRSNTWRLENVFINTE